MNLQMRQILVCVCSEGTGGTVEAQAGMSLPGLFVISLFVCLFLLLYVPSQQLWSLRDGQFT